MSPDSAPLRLLIDPLDIGPDVRAIGLELNEEGDEDPARGSAADAVWAAAIPALAAGEPWVLDFTSHFDRLRDYCRAHGIAVREAAPSCVVVTPPEPGAFLEFVQRFEAETFGFRAGAAAASGDADLENDLSSRGLDAYDRAFKRYSLCGICDFENGFLTLLTEKFSSAEVLRRLRPAIDPLGARVVRPE
ncbi:MAG TPA: hypothetical protein VLV89_05155 [Candidatus Acidoferrum sp.]|nr:hypothetical protein [Candidatus Acidoferrum sp.]